LSRFKNACLNFVLVNCKGRCFVCGAELPRTRRRHCRTYCSNACRQWDYRYRHAAEFLGKRMVIALKREIFAVTRPAG